MGRKKFSFPCFQKDEFIQKQVKHIERFLPTEKKKLSSVSEELAF